MVKLRSTHMEFEAAEKYKKSKQSTWNSSQETFLVCVESPKDNILKRTTFLESDQM
eukprot:UN13047